MAVRNNRQVKKANNTNKAATTDSFQNFNAALGQGANNLISGSTYALNPITRNRIQLENAYQGNWVVGLVVNTVADDMTKKGITIKSSLTPDDINEIEEAMLDLNIWGSLCDCIKWSRLYGGALGYIMIDGHNPEDELDITTISKGQFKGILPIDRWQVTVNVTDVITELCSDIGLPKYYTVNTQQAGTLSASFRIHHSRVLRFTGIDLPNLRKQVENMWGISIVERLWDRLVAYDSTSAGAAQLVYKAHLRTLKLPGYRNIMAVGGAPLNGLVNMVSNMRLMQSNEGITVIDADDTLEANTYNFSGLTDVMYTFLEQLSGATQIPLVRLLGQSPAGLNSTGESDMKIYSANNNREQENKLRKPMKKILEILSQSILDIELPKGTRFNFNDLLDLNLKEEADKNSVNTNTIIAAVNAGLISKEEGRLELQQLGEMFTNIEGALPQQPIGV